MSVKSEDSQDYKASGLLSPEERPGGCAVGAAQSDPVAEAALKALQDRADSNGEVRESAPSGVKVVWKLFVPKEETKVPADTDSNEDSKYSKKGTSRGRGRKGTGSSYSRKSTSSSYAKSDSTSASGSYSRKSSTGSKSSLSRGSGYSSSYGSSGGSRTRSSGGYGSNGYGSNGYGSGGYGGGGYGSGGYRGSYGSSRSYGSAGSSSYSKSRSYGSYYGGKGFTASESSSQVAGSSYSGSGRDSSDSWPGQGDLFAGLQTSSSPFSSDKATSRQWTGFGKGSTGSSSRGLASASTSKATADAKAAAESSGSDFIDPAEENFTLINQYAYDGPVPEQGRRISAREARFGHVISVSEFEQAHKSRTLSWIDQSRASCPQQDNAWPERHASGSTTAVHTQSQESAPASESGFNEGLAGNSAAQHSTVTDSTVSKEVAANDQAGQNHDRNMARDSGYAGGGESAAAALHESDTFEYTPSRRADSRSKSIMGKRTGLAARIALMEYGITKSRHVVTYRGGENTSEESDGFDIPDNDEKDQAQSAARLDHSDAGESSSARPQDQAAHAPAEQAQQADSAAISSTAMPANAAGAAAHAPNAVPSHAAGLSGQAGSEVPAQADNGPHGTAEMAMAGADGQSANLTNFGAGAGRYAKASGRKHGGSSARSERLQALSRGTRTGSAPPKQPDSNLLGGSYSMQSLPPRPAGRGAPEHMTAAASVARPAGQPVHQFKTGISHNKTGCALQGTAGHGNGVRLPSQPMLSGIGRDDSDYQLPHEARIQMAARAKSQAAAQTKAPAHSQAPYQHQEAAHSQESVQSAGHNQSRTAQPSQLSQPQSWQHSPYQGEHDYETASNYVPAYPSARNSIPAWGGTQSADPGKAVPLSGSVAQASGASQPLLQQVPQDHSYPHAQQHAGADGAPAFYQSSEVQVNAWHGPQQTADMQGTGAGASVAAGTAISSAMSSQNGTSALRGSSSGNAGKDGFNPDLAIALASARSQLMPHKRKVRRSIGSAPVLPRAASLLSAQKPAAVPGQYGPAAAAAAQANGNGHSTATGAGNWSGNSYGQGQGSWSAPSGAGEPGQGDAPYYRGAPQPFAGPAQGAVPYGAAVHSQNAGYQDPSAQGAAVHSQEPGYQGAPASAMPLSSAAASGAPAEFQSRQQWQAQPPHGQNMPGQKLPGQLANTSMPNGQVPDYQGLPHTCPAGVEQGSADESRWAGAAQDSTHTRGAEGSGSGHDYGAGTMGGAAPAAMQHAAFNQTAVSGFDKAGAPLPGGQAGAWGAAGQDGYHGTALDGGHGLGPESGFGAGFQGMPDTAMSAQGGNSQWHGDFAHADTAAASPFASSMGAAPGRYADSGRYSQPGMYRANEIAASHSMSAGSGMSAEQGWAYGPGMTGGTRMGEGPGMAGVPGMDGGPCVAGGPGMDGGPGVAGGPGMADHRGIGEPGMSGMGSWGGGSAPDEADASAWPEAASAVPGVVGEPGFYDREELEGLVERVTYHSEESGYCILRIKVKQLPDLITVTGQAASVTPGEYARARGVWVVDKDYGRQFRAEKLEIFPPNTLTGIEKYLGSGMVKGIGPACARILVEAYGEEVFDVIEKDPESMLELRGIGRKRVDRIVAGWSDQKVIRSIMVFLHSHGVSTSKSVRIFKRYGPDAIDKVTENPYCLARDIRGIGFKSADTIARSLGIGPHSEIRANAGVAWTLSEFSNDGHCCVPRWQLVKKAIELLQIPEDIIDNAIDHEIRTGELICANLPRKNSLYLAPLYRAEIRLAESLADLSEGFLPWPEIDPQRALPWVEYKLGITLAESQKEAVATALSSRLLVITGGPGVGKTTIIKSILTILSVKNIKISLCAPTGRAARRLSESSGYEATTIHRLLEVDPATMRFVRDSDNPLDCDLLVVDECSMVDIPMANSLLKAVPPHAAVILVGDVDQLPSVGPGAFLADVISSMCIPVIRLTEVFRQAATSWIIRIAHQINRGEMPDFPGKGVAGDCYFVTEEDLELINSTIVELVCQRLPRAYGFDPLREIQVLCPMNRSESGARALNLAIKAALNPANENNSVVRYGTTFSVGDKVMQIENNYDREVYNGDMGFVTGINFEDEEMTINFEGNEVVYPFTELDEVVLCYATTIHKSQGSEFPVVVMPVTMQHYMMLRRNLIYTGVTRGKKMVVMVGQKKALDLAIRDLRTEKRNSGLCDNIQKLLYEPDLVEIAFSSDSGPAGPDSSELIAAADAAAAAAAANEQSNGADSTFRQIVGGKRAGGKDADEQPRKRRRRTADQSSIEEAASASSATAGAASSSATAGAAAAPAASAAATSSGDDSSQKGSDGKSETGTAVRKARAGRKKAAASCATAAAEAPGSAAGAGAAGTAASASPAEASESVLDWGGDADFAAAAAAAFAWGDSVEEFHKRQAAQTAQTAQTAPKRKRGRPAGSSKKNKTAESAQ